jgi:hypothetical protein
VPAASTPLLLISRPSIAAISVSLAAAAGVTSIVPSCCTDAALMITPVSLLAACAAAADDDSTGDVLLLALLSPNAALSPSEWDDRDTYTETAEWQH